MLENISVLAHSAIRIKGSKTLYFDPYHVRKKYRDADLVFVSHSHHDHLSPADIDKVATEDTLFFMPENCVAQAVESGIAREKIIGLKPWDEVPFLNLKIQAIPAYNVERTQFHPKENNWLGYVVTMDGVRYYVAGDTEDNEDIRKVSCDVALVPVGGKYTMTAESAAEFVNAIHPKAAVPTHFGDIVGTAEDAERFKSLLAEDIER